MESVLNAAKQETTDLAKETESPSTDIKQEIDELAPAAEPSAADMIAARRAERRRRGGTPA